VLDGLRRRRAWVQIAAATLSGNSLRQTVHNLTRVPWRLETQFLILACIVSIYVNDR